MATYFLWQLMPALEEVIMAKIQMMNDHHKGSMRIANSCSADAGLNLLLNDSPHLCNICDA